MANLTKLELLAINGNANELGGEIKLGNYNKSELNKPMIRVLDDFGMKGDYIDGCLHADSKILADDLNKINILIEEGIDLNSGVNGNSILYYVLTIPEQYLCDIIELLHVNGADFSTIKYDNNDIIPIDYLKDIMCDMVKYCDDEYKDEVKQEALKIQKAIDLIKTF